MPNTHGPNGSCPGYLEEQYIDGGQGRISCPWCAVALIRDGNGILVHQGRRKPWARCNPPEPQP